MCLELTALVDFGDQITKIYQGHPDDNTTADLRLVLVSKNRYVDIKNATGNSYNKTIGEYDNVANTVITRDYAVTSSNSGNFQNVLWILDSISDAAQHFSSEYNMAFPQVTINWQGDADPSAFPGGGSYEGSFYRNNVIYLDGVTPDDSERRFTILHEYGHHVMNNTYSSYPPRLAISENFASYVAVQELVDVEPDRARPEIF